MAMPHAEVARRLLHEHDAGEPFHALEPEAGVGDLSSAYAVQRELVELLRPRGGATAGYKIGLTSLRMQRFCGIDQPSRFVGSDPEAIDQTLGHRAVNDREVDRLADTSLLGRDRKFADA